MTHAILFKAHGKELRAPPLKLKSSHSHVEFGILVGRAETEVSDLIQEINFIDPEADVVILENWKLRHHPKVESYTEMYAYVLGLRKLHDELTIQRQQLLLAGKATVMNEIIVELASLLPTSNLDDYRIQDVPLLCSGETETSPT